MGAVRRPDPRRCHRSCEPRRKPPDRIPDLPDFRCGRRDVHSCFRLWIASGPFRPQGERSEAGAICQAPVRVDAHPGRRTDSERSRQTDRGSCAGGDARVARRVHDTVLTVATSAEDKGRFCAARRVSYKSGADCFRTVEAVANTCRAQLPARFRLPCPLAGCGHRRLVQARATLEGSEGLRFPAPTCNRS